MGRALPLALWALPLLAGCASPRDQPLPGVTRSQELRCEAQARAAAAAANRSSLPLQAEIRLQEACLQAFLAENVEEAGRAAGFHWELGSGRLTNEQRAAIGGLAQGCGAPDEHVAWMRAQVAPFPAEVDAWKRGVNAAAQARPGACALARSTMASLTAQRAGR